MTKEEKTAIGYLPSRLARAVLDAVSPGDRPFAELRLRCGGPLSVTMTYPKENILCGVICTTDELAHTTEKLCGGSLYAHAESIREGVIVTAEGLRAGVCGRAVVQKNTIMCVRDLSSVNIRIPHRVPGAGTSLCDIVCTYGSTLLVSPPGMGKTTALRELIPLLAGGKHAKRTAVIDTRFELGAGMEKDNLADFYSGWPRAEGMAAAVRTMAPDCILCDEIAGEQDCAAVQEAHAAGVCVIASAHGNSPESIRKNPHLKCLIEERIFSCICGIEDGKTVIWEIPGQVERKAGA